MNILFLHPNMPGQYRNLARVLGASGEHRIYFITRHKTAQIPGVRRVTYETKKNERPPGHPYLFNAEQAIRQGQTVWKVAKLLQQRESFTPDIVVCHPGWGDALFIKDAFPTTRVLSFCEFFYRAHGADVGFDPAEPTTDDDCARLRVKNVTNLMNLELMDWGISPTVWQWSVHPEAFRERISVLHDGIDVDFCRPNQQAALTLPDGTQFRKGDEVITYIARNLEPYRGFPTFMRAAEIVLRARPNAHIIAVGADDVSYGKRPPVGTTYRQILSTQVSLPQDRIHFTGRLPYDQLIAMLQLSRAHLYLTYPFVLSWSMLEAMACGVALVASDTAPVKEVVTHGQNGLLVNMFSPEDVADRLIQLIEDKHDNQAMREAARATVVERFALHDIMPYQVRLVEEIARGEVPPPVAQAIQEKSPIGPYAPVMWL